MKRIFVTGAGGMLGRYLVPILEGEYAVKATDLPETDVRNAESVIASILDYDPDFVIHLASLTDVDECQKEPDAAFSINTLGTRNVALACSRADAVMVYISTGMIYGGDKMESYTEYDPPSPVNIYGLSKYHGELYINHLLNRFYIFYTCWLFGGAGADKKFVPKILSLAREEKSLEVVDDKFGSPTYTKDLSLRITDTIRTGLYGRYHCANTGVASRHELAREIIRTAGIEGCQLKAVSSKRFPLPAPRPRMEALRNYNFELMGNAPMRSWREALAEYVQSELL